MKRGEIMNFNDTLLAAELVIKTEEVPLIVGESGIGKTALAKALAEKNNFQLFVIDGNLLKEGEIGGLPTVEDYRYINDQGIEIVKKRTVYAVHTKLQQIENAINENRQVLLFIDEINRCEHTVQQELMNLILNKEINGYNLSKSVKILAAMNPPNKGNDNFDYQIIDMDPAQENRFVWLYMESDVDSWIQWAIKSELEDKVIEFIATFPEYLHSNEDEFVKATPRSFERVSKAYKIYKNNNDDKLKKIFYSVVKGNVGSKIAQEFLAFIDRNLNPLISPKEILSGKSLDEDLIKKIKSESHTRLHLTIKNLLNFLNKDELCDETINRVVEFINKYPIDLKVSVMKEIKQNYGEIYKYCIGNKAFVEMYFKTYENIIN